VRVFFISLRRRPSVIYRFVNHRLGPSLDVVRRFKSRPGGGLCDLVDLDFFSPARRPRMESASRAITRDTHSTTTRDWSF